MATLQNYNISVRALRNPTKSVISTLLNPKKILTTLDGYSRDWRGLFALCKIDGQFMASVQDSDSQFDSIVEMWTRVDSTESTIENLLYKFETLDRYDIIADIRHLLDYDVKCFQSIPDKPNLDADSYILTRDDVSRINKGLEPQNYDAFVLFSDDDIDFATELIDTMEKQYQLKMCVKERDLVGGVFEYDAMIKLITERCSRLIVIISQSFIDSLMHNFFLRFTQSLEIGQQQRKVIPCIYKPCTSLPPALSCCFLLDYRKSGKLFNFWEKLRDSIEAPALNQKKLIEPISSSSSTAVTQIIPKETTTSTATNKEPINIPIKKSQVKFTVDCDVNSKVSTLEKANVSLKAKTCDKLPWLKKVIPDKSLIQKKKRKSKVLEIAR